MISRRRRLVMKKIAHLALVQRDHERTAPSGVGKRASSPLPGRLLLFGGVTLQSLCISDTDAALRGLHDPGLPKISEGPGHRHTPRPDHGSQLRVGVVSGYLVAFAVHHSLAG